MELVCLTRAGIANTGHRNRAMQALACAPLHYRSVGFPGVEPGIPCPPDRWIAVFLEAVRNSALLPLLACLLARVPALGVLDDYTDGGSRGRRRAVPDMTAQPMTAAVTVCGRAVRALASSCLTAFHLRLLPVALHLLADQRREQDLRLACLCRILSLHAEAVAVRVHLLLFPFFD